MATEKDHRLMQRAAGGASLIADLQAELASRGDPKRREWWENYVKGAAFRGVTMGEIRTAVRDWLAAAPGLTTSETKRLALDLIREPLSEDKLAGILVLSEHVLDDLGPADLPAFRALLADGHLGDWGSCDWFCVKVLGRMLNHSPEAERLADEIVDWTKSDDLWLRRAGLVAFVNLAPKGDAALPGLTKRVLEGAERNAQDSRRFVQTSVGWTLRELSKAEPDAVRRFLEQHGDRLSAEIGRASCRERV
jgi:3-methyladenine DNA glycosylase AlkD